MSYEKRIKRLETLIEIQFPYLVQGEREKRVSAIQKVVCQQFNLSLERLLSKQRAAGVVWPRQIAMALAYELSHLSTTRLADLFHIKDHGTILHACQRVRNEEQIRNGLSADVSKCRELAKKAINP